ncbi:MAG TPA: methyltransferase domain-containing protein [Oculatellaceae cyanobacterium]|jgi:hypothetical protein
MLGVDFWQERYETGQTPWDLGGPSPHFVELLKHQPDWLKAGKMAVPGSGRGHDAALFAQAGFEVIGFDYSPGAIMEAKGLYGETTRFEQADIFQLGAAESTWLAQFDYVLEHTCFCAILPEQRGDYVKNMKALLKPDSLLIGVFWEHAEWGGPPFSTSLQDIQTHFETDFDILLSENKTPARGRNGLERLTVLRRK